MLFNNGLTMEKKNNNSPHNDRWPAHSMEEELKNEKVRG